MKATDFNLPNEIQYDYDKGITSFKGSRLLIFDANIIGLQRQNIIEFLGSQKAKEFFFKMNFQNGFEEFSNMKENYKFDNELELLASGPTIHTWRGIVQATPQEFKMDREKGEFYYRGIWKNSWEAEQHLLFNGISKEAVCWSLTGFASGWSSAFFGEKTIAMETSCVGKGDDHCEWVIKDEFSWGDEVNEYKEIVIDF